MEERLPSFDRSDVLSQEHGDIWVRDSARQQSQLARWRAYRLVNKLREASPELLPVLQVPSAIIPSEWNFLINPAHSLFPRLRWRQSEPFRFDPRLLAAAE